MAEKDRKRQRKSAEQRMTEARQRAEHDVAALDNPDVADEPSEIRHTLYFLGVVGFALLLNVVALLVASGGR